MKREHLFLAVLIAGCIMFGMTVKASPLPPPECEQVQPADRMRCLTWQIYEYHWEPFYSYYSMNPDEAAKFVTYMQRMLSEMMTIITLRPDLGGDPNALRKKEKKRTW